MSLALRPLGLSLACLGLSFACATAQDDPFLQGTGGRVDTAGKGGGGATAGSAGQTGKGGSSGSGSSGKGGTSGSAGNTGKGGAGGSSGAGSGGGGRGGGAGDDAGSSGSDAGGMGGSPAADPCTPEGIPPAVHVLLKNDSNNVAEDPKANFRLVNATEEDLPLGELTVRYYFTSEFECTATVHSMTIDVTYAQVYEPYADIGKTSVTTQVVVLEDQGNSCAAYFELGFVDTAPALDPGDEAAVGFFTQIPIHDGTRRDQTNDFSYGACRTKRAWWDRVTVYRDGVRVSGSSPDNDPGEGGAGGQGGQGGLGGVGGEAGDAGGQAGLGGADAGGAAGTESGGASGAPGEAGGAGDGAGGATAGGPE